MDGMTMLDAALIADIREERQGAQASNTEKPGRPRVWTAFATLAAAVVAGQAAALIAFVATGVLIGLVMGVQGADAAAIEARVQDLLQNPLPMLLLTLIPCQIGMAAVLLFAAWRSPEPMKQRLGLVPQARRKYGAFGLATMACFTIAAAFAANIISTLILGTPPVNDLVASAVTDGSWWTVLLVSALLSVIPALMEESLFRGYIQQRLLKRWSPAVAITVSTLVFAILHFDSVQHIIAVIPLGLVTGLLAWRTNSARPGMLVHGLHNVAAVVAAAVLPLVGARYGADILGIAVLGAIFVLGLIGLPMVISLLRGDKPRPVVATSAVPEPNVESQSAVRRELNLSDSVTDSRFSAQAV